MDTFDISVLIYARNREKTLATCLTHFESQTFPAARFEVLVVEDGSTDSTAELLRHFAEGTPTALRVLTLGGVGVAKGRNEAAKAACGRWLLFLDADLLASPVLVEKHVRAQEAFASQCGIVGSVALHPSMDPRTFTRWVMPETHPDLPDDRPLEPWEWRGGNLSLPRTVFLDAGGFSTDFAYPVFCDVELGWRLGNRGVEARFIRDAHAYIWRPADFAEERRRQYAKGYTLYSLLRTTRLPRMLAHYQVGASAWRHRLESLYMPHYARACAQVEADAPLFNRFYRRVLRYELRRGYHDARCGRRPKEPAPSF